jgi:outer membrane protein assembly factor BamD (BamD/ComL family)
VESNRLWTSFLAALVALAAIPARSQTSPDEQARRLLEDGRTYRAQGKLKQALDNFNTIVSGFPTSEAAPAALLEIGRYRAEVEGETEKARIAFEQVAQRFPQSDGAPGAYYYLGWLGLERATTPAELDDALAQFTRVQRLYPRSEWVPRALYASGLVHRKAGRFADAVEAGRRVSLEYPTSEAAPAAQFLIGHSLALMGEPRQAMEEFQQVRNRFPESELAGQALDKITALYRLFGQDKPAFSLDTSFVAPSGESVKGIRALVLDPHRVLWAVSEKLNAFLGFGPDAKVAANQPAQDPESLSLSAKGEVVATSKTAVRIGTKDVKSFAVPTDKPGQLDSLGSLRAAVQTASGMTLVADEKKKHVYRFDQKGEFKGIFPDVKEREVTRLVLDGEGGIALLDGAEKSVRVYDDGGKLLRTVLAKGAGYELRRPSDIVLDAFRNLYVADEEGAVRIFLPGGQLLATLAGEESKRPRALALDPSGALLVYDAKTSRVLRYK